MDFYSLIKSRHSIRKFLPKAVPVTLINKILNAVRTAPSAGNLQSYEVIIVSSEARKEALSLASLEQSFISEAPVVLAFLADSMKSANRYGSRGASLYAVQDATIACTYAHLMACELGLGSVWVGAFDEKRVNSILNAGDKRCVALLPIGYSAQKPVITKRREIKEFTHQETL